MFNDDFGDLQAHANCGRARPPPAAPRLPRSQLLPDNTYLPSPATFLARRDAPIETAPFRLQPIPYSPGPRTQTASDKCQNIFWRHSAYRRESWSFDRGGKGMCKGGRQGNRQRVWKGIGRPRGRKGSISACDRIGTSCWRRANQSRDGAFVGPLIGILFKVVDDTKARINKILSEPEITAVREARRFLNLPSDSPARAWRFGEPVLRPALSTSAQLQDWYLHPQKRNFKPNWIERGPPDPISGLELHTSGVEAAVPNGWLEGSAGVEFAPPAAPFGLQKIG